MTSLLVDIQDASEIFSVAVAVEQGVAQIWNEAAAEEQVAWNDVSPQLTALKTAFTNIQTADGFKAKVEDLPPLIQAATNLVAALATTTVAVQASSLWSEIVTQATALQTKVETLLTDLGVLSASTSTAGTPAS